MSRIRFWQGSRNSKGAFKLRKELRSRGHNVLRLKYINSRYLYRDGDIIINWGTRNTLSIGSRGSRGSRGSISMLNGNLSSMRICSDKLLCFKKWEQDGISTPLFTENKREAQLWLESTSTAASSIYCRTLLSSNSGRGIVISHSSNEVVDAPLYTAEVTQISRELRAHVFNGSIILLTEKRRMGSERLVESGITLNEAIRNHGNGHIFARRDVRPLTDWQEEEVIKSYVSLGIDFCALDIIEQEDGSMVFLEANTAPGLEGSTIGDYANAITGLRKRV